MKNIAQKEHHIILYGWEVRAILDGRKTQLRRLVKFPKSICEEWDISGAEAAYDVFESVHPGAFGFLVAGDHGITDLIHCPYGIPGDRLWVREVFQICSYCPGEYGGQGEAGYPITGPIREEPATGSYCLFYAADSQEDGPWRPSIHMPRWASRITLEVTDVRAERLGPLGTKEAEADGFVSGNRESSSDAFMNFWTTSNPDAWEKQHYVWVIEFKKDN